MTPRLIVVAVVRHGQRDGQPTFVVTRRRHGDFLGGQWELPGGKVDVDERPDDALRRELREELGVDVGALQPLTFSHHAYPDRTLLLLFYATHTVEGSPAPTPLAADALQLVTRAELLALPMPPANAPLKYALASNRTLP